MLIRATLFMAPLALREIVLNNPIMMSIGFALGLVLGGFPLFNSELITLALVVMMSLSLCGISFKGLDVREHLSTTILALLLTFGLGTGSTLLIAFLFEDPIRSGWIIEAVVPSAVCVIPFTFLLRGNVENSLVSTAIIYIASIGVTPILMIVILGMEVNPMSLVGSVLIMIFFPIIISRGVKRVTMSADTRVAIINLSLLAVSFAVVGANREFFFRDPYLIVVLLAAATARVFIPGLAVYWIALKSRFGRKQGVNMVLFTTYKNTGMAAALAATLIGTEAALPAAISTPVEIIWLLIMTKFMFTEGYFKGKGAGIMSRMRLSKERMSRAR
jgi:BASS family bile acid:Na+ symporter